MYDDYDGGGNPRRRTGAVKKLVGRIHWFFVKMFNSEAAREEAEERQWHEKTNFTDAELKEIRTAIRTCPDSSPTIAIKGLTFPAPGHIFKLKAGANYQLMKPESLVFVNVLEIWKQYWTYPEHPVQAVCMSLGLDGRLEPLPPVPIRVEDLEPVPNEAELTAKWNAPPSHTPSPFTDGDAVETTDEIVLARQSMMGAVAMKLPKGLKGVVEAPQLKFGASLEDINSTHRTQKIPTATYYRIVLADGQDVIDMKRRVFSMPLHATGDAIDVYVPAFRQTTQFQVSQLKKREFEKGLLDRVVMSDETRRQILWLANSNEDDLRKWNISSFQKGTGKVFLAYGPPGTGKTMTGEALAEYLGRPLYLVNSADLGVYTTAFEDKFKQMIERTARWNAVTVIDEAESILQSRDHAYGDSSARVTAVLRNLELLERGLIWFTTNRAFDIDIAIDSRTRSHIYFPFLDEVQRRHVWQNTLPQGMPIATLHIERLLDELATHPLNGREIRNTIVNAADMASSDKKTAIPGEYLVNAAQIILKNQKTLKDAKNEDRPADPKVKTGQYI